MDPSDVENLRKAHGSSVSRYLCRHNIVQKTVSGAFVISPRECFDKCRELVLNEIETMEKKKTSVVTDDITEKDRKCKHKSFGEQVKLSEHKPRNANEMKKSFKDISVATWVTVYFRKKKEAFKKTKWHEKRLPTALCFSRSIKQRSHFRYNSIQLYEVMMTTEIGRGTKVDYQACFQDIALILTEFQNRHASYPYHKVLQRILNEKVHKKSEDQLEITLKQYQLFVYKIIADLIPKSLFGCNKNEKLLRKALKAYYLSPFQAPICLKQYILSFNISKIPWLQKIKHTNTRWSVIAKVTKWFFENFFIVLFKAVFRERKSLYSEKRIMMSAATWNKFQHNYIVRELNEGRLVKVDPNDDCKIKDIPSGKLKLHPKPTGVRPIYRLRFTTHQKNELEMLRTLLQQLYLQKYCVMDDRKLHTTWLTYAKPSIENTKRNLNIVTCDVADAFGSIIQKKLFDIVNGMINEVPYEKLPLEWYSILLPTRKNQMEIRLKRWFSCWPATFAARNHSLIAITKTVIDKPLYVKKEYALGKLEAYIFDQHVDYKHKKYELRRGIIQGSPLSSILSDIYYEHMAIQEFGNFMQSGTLLRYVDDYIYMTKNEDIARRFLKAIKKNVPEYNCQFPKSKMQTNVKSKVCKNSEWVTYLGYRLNGDTMEICPDYAKREFQYLRCMRYTPRKNFMDRFRKLFMNMTCLKLNHIVLDSRINSLITLCTTARVAAKIMAVRCATFILKIFKDATQYTDGILEIIHIALKKVEGTFCEYLTAGDRAKLPSFRRKIRIALWQSYFRVFSRYLKLRELFCKKIKIMIQNQTIR